MCHSYLSGKCFNYSGRWTYFYDPVRRWQEHNNLYGWVRYGDGELMAHYAILDENNKVTNVIVGRDEDDLLDGITSWEDHYGQVHGATVKRTSYNTSGGVHYTGEIDDDGKRIPSDDQTKAFRFHYASKAFTYDPDADVFIPPRPEKVNIDDPEWTLDTTTYTWVQA